jgi:Zn-dependent protease
MTILLDLLRPEVLLSLALMAVILVRMPVRPRVSMLINAAPERVFQVLDVQDGKHIDYGRSAVTQRLIDMGRNLYRFSYQSLMHNGRIRETNAEFVVAERIHGEKLVLQRHGLDGKPKANQLLRIEHRLVREGDATRLHTQYDWGPRLMMSQLIARADLLGGIYRTKGLAENGLVNERPYHVISLVIAAITALLSVVAFAFFLGTTVAVAIVFVIFVHELGHMLAYRLLGQPWGRMMFLPFLGAIAIPKLPFEKQWQLIFAALMGPGFSVLLAAGCFFALSFNLYPQDYRQALIWIGLLTVVLNVMNLIPIEPLDGGVVLRSVLARLTKNYARIALIGIGLCFAGLGLYLGSSIILLFGLLAISFNIKPRKIDEGLTPLTRAQLAYGATAFVGLFATYALLFVGLLGHLQG